MSSETRFTTAADIFDRLHCLTAADGDVFTVTHVTQADLRDLDRERDVRERRVRFLYEPDQQSGRLVVTIPTGPHETVHGELKLDFLIEVYRMGLNDAWKQIGSTTFPVDLYTTETTSPTFTGSICEADAGGGPWPDRSFRGSWPTVVFEVGYTLSLDDLYRKRDFWFSRSHHDVKIVLLIKIIPDSPDKRIRIEQWQERPRTATNPRPGVTLTRQASAAFDPVCVQTLQVAWRHETIPYDQANDELQRDPSSFHVMHDESRDGPLTLDFAQCFLREPVGPDEHDIVLTDESLQRCTMRVWDME